MCERESSCSIDTQTKISFSSTFFSFNLFIFKKIFFFFFFLSRWKLLRRLELFGSVFPFRFCLWRDSGLLFGLQRIVTVVSSPFVNLTRVAGLVHSLAA